MRERLIKTSIVINYGFFFFILVFSFTAPTTLFTFIGSNFQISFYLSLLAVPFFYICYFFFYRNKQLNEIIKLIAVLFLLLFLSSLGMAFFYYTKYQGLFDTTPTRTVAEEAFKYAYDLSLLPYFIYMLSFMNKKITRYFMYSFITAWILFGIFQIVTFLVNDQTLWEIYDSVNFLKCIGGTSEMFARIRQNYGYFRFYGISSEPSTNATIITVLFLPFLLYEIFANSIAWYSDICHSNNLIVCLCRIASVYNSFRCFLY